MFNNGDRVEHTSWRNRDRTGPATGTVRTSAGDTEGGMVEWDGSYVSDSVEFVGAQNLRRTS